MSVPTDFILLRFHLAEPYSLTSAMAAFCASNALVKHRVAWAGPGVNSVKPEETGLAYLYARLHDRAHVPDEAREALAQSWAEHCPGATGVSVSRLELKLDRPGCSQAEPPGFHYVVETDPESGWDAEIYRWYDTEHMPGLAAVPGCIHARRLINHDAGAGTGVGDAPRSFACYDLVSPDALTSAPWLAVRGTAWSDICRPHFTNTRRTMMQALA